MADILIALHAILGELGIAAFLWVFIELLNPDQKRVIRATRAAQIATILFVLSWIVGGYYYLTVYGNEVKPLIKGGPAIWGHDVVMEVKEHLFLFLPFVSFFAAVILKTKQQELLENKDIQRAVQILTVVVIIIGALMAGMGYLISSSARDALEVLAQP